MNRVRQAIAATLVSASFLAVGVMAQSTPQAPPMQSVLAGKKFQPPLKGQVEVEYVKPDTKRVKDMVVTKIVVKNISNGPIGRLTIDETWFDKGGGLVTGGKGFLKAPLQAGEVQTITIETPYNAKMNANSWNFSHANGTVKPKRVAKLDAPATKEPAAKPAASTKAPAKKK